jgi:tripartite ATP-independent transporter DctP family solute receptor
LNTLSRAKFVAGSAAAAFASVGILRYPAGAAEVNIKIGVDLASDHPTPVFLADAANAIAKASNGAVAVQVFPNNQLGNDDRMLSQVRSGALEIMAIGDNILATLVPAAAIDNVGFAWKNGKEPFVALDGALGVAVRAEIEKTGLYTFDKIWDEGFREITTSTKPIHTPADLAGFKMRVPPSPISTSLMKDLGAAPTTINVADLYTALQTKLVDGQENPLALIETHKFYEVQKFCSLTNHMWVGYWLIANGDWWKSVPKKYQDVIAQTLNAAALRQRPASEKLNDTLQGKLTQQGLTFNTTETAPFRAKLVQSGFYTEWKAKFGDKLWNLLEKYTGPLA